MHATGTVNTEVIARLVFDLWCTAGANLASHAAEAGCSTATRRVCDTRVSCSARASTHGAREIKGQDQQAARFDGGAAEGSRGARGGKMHLSYLASHGLLILCAADGPCICVWLCNHQLI